MITLDELHAICPLARTSKLALYIDHLNKAMLEFDINTTQREEFFLAQISHESGSFNYVHEIASGAAYEGREDLGNTEKGDGIRFKGRGLIQITGRNNYRACGDALGVDLLNNPSLLERPDLACRSAGWFWKSRGINEIADKGDFLMATKRINGGTNGMKDRMAYLARAQEVLA